jgi:hypothetical protein
MDPSGLIWDINRKGESKMEKESKLRRQIEILKLERDEWRQAAVSLEEARDRWRKLYEQTLAIAVQVTDQ